MWIFRCCLRAQRPASPTRSNDLVRESRNRDDYSSLVKSRLKKDTKWPDDEGKTYKLDDFENLLKG
jgi:hypothetical protein